MTGIFGGETKPPAGGNPDSNTLISDMTTVICLDDYHSLDRNGRKEKAVTALAPESQNFDLMYEQASGGMGKGKSASLLVVWIASLGVGVGVCRGGDARGGQVNSGSQVSGSRQGRQAAETRRRDSALASSRQLASGQLASADLDLPGT